MPTCAPGHVQSSPEHCGFCSNACSVANGTATCSGGTLGSSSPGASVSWPSTVTLMGISLTNPATYAWPSAPTSVPSASRVDMDGDGKPAVTTTFVNGGGYVQPLVTIGGNRADLVYIASRLAFSLNGSLTSCSASSGSATITRVDGLLRLQLREQHPGLHLDRGADHRSGKSRLDDGRRQLRLATRGSRRRPRGDS